MSLKIRLRQQGKKGKLCYRLVVTDSRYPRDGKYCECLGWYNPHGTSEELQLNVKADRVEYWLSCGAQLTEKARALVKRYCPTTIQSKVKKKTKET